MLEAQHPGGRFPNAQMTNLHLVDPIVWKFAAHPAVVNVARAMAGRDDLVLLSATLIAKYPSAKGRIGWHQDLAYWDIDPSRALTTWLAVDVVDEETGCVRFVNGSHAEGLITHSLESEDADNLLLSKQAISNVSEEKAACVTLDPGSLSVHDGFTVHGSLPNTSRDRRRLGLVANWIGADVEVKPSTQGYGAHIPEFRLPTDPTAAFPPPILQKPGVHPRFLEPGTC